MRKVRLGRTGLDVSPICFGTWAFGGDWGDFDADEATAAIHHALELGINFFDTAQGYGFGTSEELLGRSLWQRVKREDVIVATKGGLRQDGDDLLRDSSAEWLTKGVEASLGHLGTDYIDLYQVHWPDADTPDEETGSALAKLVEAGKIRHVGVSNFSPEQMDSLSAHVQVEALQPPYHMFAREIEAEVLPYAERNDIGVLVYGPLAHGLLAGRWDESTTFDDGDWRSGSPDFSGDTFRRNLAVVEKLKGVAERLGVTLPQLAVAWTLANPAVDVAIVGGRRPDQLDGTASGADVQLSDDDLRTIDGILADAASVQGPSPEM
jgi:aryl-alcohol dehydrogenase-like predicted oxidoreductase